MKKLFGISVDHQMGTPGLKQISQDATYTPMYRDYLFTAPVNKNKAHYFKVIFAVK